MWTQWSDGALFMFMLKRLHSHLDENKIPYYWDSRCNLLDALGYAVNNMKYKIQRIIKEIDNSLDNPEVLAKYLLTADEFADFRRRYGSIEEGFESLSIDSAPPVSDLRGDSRCCIL
ncbi:uncharacterized protein LOC113385486 [Ctenocephalides felis]|nr:uncharacterized protein LOC113385486 [Ctenocephalides felis]